MAKSNFDITKRQLTLRLPTPLVRTVKTIAKRRKITVNALLVALVEQCEREEQERALQAAYELLGTKGDNDVEYAHRAQREVVNGR